MSDKCHACGNEAIARIAKALVWITCEKCGVWAVSGELHTRLNAPKGELPATRRRLLEKILHQPGYGTGADCLRVLLYREDLPSISPLADVVPIQVDELSDTVLLSDGRLTDRANAFRGDYNRGHVLLNPGAFADNRFMLP